MPMNPNAFGTNMNMNMGMNMQMPNMMQGGGNNNNPFATSPNPMMNMNMGGFNTAQPMRNNDPFSGGSSAFPQASNQANQASKYAAPSFGGPSTDSWEKDGANPYSGQVKRRDDGKNDQVEEFKNLYDLANTKIKPIAQQKPAVDLSYNPAPLQQAAPQQQQQTQPVQ